MSSLHRACWNGDTALAAELLNDGKATINEQLKSGGFTALMFASRNGHTDTVQMLCDKGANLDIQCNEGWTALHYAGWMDHLQTCIALVSRGADANLKDHRDRTPCVIYGEYPLFQPPMTFAVKQTRIAAVIQALAHYERLGQPLSMSHDLMY